MNRHGFALPATVLIVTLLTLLLATGFTRVRADRLVGSGSEDAARALAVAQSGLQTYANLLTTNACNRPIRPPTGDSVRINVPNGYADVVARVVKRPMVDTLQNWTYVLRSTGHYILPSAGATPRARRTVAQLAYWQSGSIGLRAAFTAANGLTRAAGGTGEFRGVDQNPIGGCQRTNIWGLRVPAGEAPNLTDFVTTGASPIVQTTGTGLGVTVETAIDWANTVAGAMTPDYTTIVANNWSYPLMFVNGNATMGASGTDTYGTGLVIVTGDLTVAGNFVQWYGVVLVGGRIIFNANDQRFDGAVASGLNERLGSNPPLGQIGGGTGYLDIDYDSRYVELAMQSVSGFALLRNTWIDNWTTY